MSVADALAVSALIASQIGTAPGAESGIGSTIGTPAVRRVSASAKPTGAGVRGALIVGAGVRGAGIVRVPDEANDDGPPVPIAAADRVGISASGLATGFGFVALVLASVNIFGGFLVTQRMLAMYKKKEK